MKKMVNILFLALVVLGLCLGGCLTLLGLKDASTGLFWENRSRQEAPKLSGETLWSGSFFTDLDGYLSDRFPQRDKLITLDTKLDLTLGRPSVHGVAQGEGAIFPFHGYYRWDASYMAAEAQKMAEKLGVIRDAAASYGGKLYYVGVPQQYSYYHDKYPAYMDDRQWLLTPANAAFSAALEEAGIPFVDMSERFDALGHPDAFYLPSDHHYSYQGALTTYQTLIDQVNADTGWDLPVTTPEDLELTALPNPFLGSQNRKLYGLWPTTERLYVGTLKTPIPFTRRDNGQETAATLYHIPEDPQEWAAYGVYMGGDVAETVIETNRPELPKCLLWGDSFTNAVETLLWTSFDETRSLDLRHYTAKTLSDYIAEYQPDVIICLRDDSSYTSFVGNGDFT